MNQDINRRHKKIIVLGAGESGAGAAILAKAKGFEVFVSDKGMIRPKYKAMLDEHGIEWEEGKHTLNKLLDADEAIKSPGIDPRSEIIMSLKSKSIPIISEIEFAGRYTSSKMVCITGSNGKTTTTLLIYHILKKAGFDVGLAGNVGNSLALQVAESPHEVYVIELSSFQLENMYDFKADVAIMTNITPDHLDRYDYKMDGYIAAKFRIIQNQTKDDYFIYWKDDPIVKAQVEQLKIEARSLPFAEKREDGLAAFVDDGMIQFLEQGNQWEMPRSELALPGLHNLYNSMAAGLSATALNVRNETIREALGDFAAVEHRLELVATVAGVRYINDSKATNVNSTWYALESMTAPTILILGGKDKGNDYSEIEDLVAKKVKAIVCMGVDNTKILDFFKDKVAHIADTHSLDDAIKACRKYAVSGDCVLLSPCCASFDLFKSYEHRGQLFKEAVANLKANEDNLTAK